MYELKWDGMRLVVFITRSDDGTNQVRLQSSNGRDVTTSFPEMQALSGLADHFDGIVLDGEIVAFDGDKPSFNTLQTRMHVSDPERRRSSSRPNAHAIRRVRSAPSRRS